MLDKLNISLIARREEQEDSPGHHVSILHKAIYAVPSLSAKREVDMFCSEGHKGDTAPSFFEEDLAMLLEIFSLMLMVI